MAIEIEGLSPKAVALMANPRPLERIGTFGLTGSGKTYQWLLMARALKPTGAVFRCIDFDGAVDFMLYEQFPDLLPMNGGNVFTFQTYTWPTYKVARKWLMQEQITSADMQIAGIMSLTPDQLVAYQTPIKHYDWWVLDMMNEPWKEVSRFYTSSIFSEDMGDYFMEIRKKVHEEEIASGGKKKVSSIDREALQGWTDWSVINKMYFDFWGPIISMPRCHMYVTSNITEISSKEKDQSILNLYGGLGIRMGGQKDLGHKMHCIQLYKAGKDVWQLFTIKDRGKRPYAVNDPLYHFYLQYMVAKAGWPSPADM